MDAEIHSANPHKQCQHYSDRDEVKAKTSGGSGTSQKRGERQICNGPNCSVAARKTRSENFH